MPFGFLVLRGGIPLEERAFEFDESQMPFGFLVLRGGTTSPVPPANSASQMPFGFLVLRGHARFLRLQKALSVSNAFRLFGSEGIGAMPSESGKGSLGSQMPFGFLVLRGKAG